MKKVFVILFMALPLVGFSQSVYYVSTSGVDDPGRSGSIGQEFALPSYAATRATTSGDIIYVNSGSYTDNNRCDISLGVSMTGNPNNRPTITTSYSVPSDSYAYIRLASASGGASANGNQSISYINFNGNSDACRAAISIYYRSHVTVHHCNFDGFRNRAIWMYGNNTTLSTTPPMAIPIYYAYGNSVYDCVITNCNRGESGVTSAAIHMKGQSGLVIDNVSITSNREGVYNGDCISGWANQGCKITDCTFYRKDEEFEGGWNFFMEIHNSTGGMEFLRNHFYGLATLDFSGCIKGDYDFGGKICDNYFTTSTNAPVNAPSHGAPYIDIEAFDVSEDVIITGNHLKYAHKGVLINNCQTSASRILIAYNLIEGVGNTDITYAMGIQVISSWGFANSPRTFSNIDIFNNVFTASTQSYAAIHYVVYGNLNYGDVRNNIIYGNNNFTYPIAFTGNYSGCQVSNYNINKNIVYQCDNAIRYNLGTYPATFNSLNSTDSEMNVDPLFVSATDFRLQMTSPAINTGMDVGLTLDYFGNVVPAGIAPDIGIFEFLAEPPPPVPSGDGILGKDRTGVMLKDSNGKPIIIQ